MVPNRLRGRMPRGAGRYDRMVHGAQGSGGRRDARGGREKPEGHRSGEEGGRFATQSSAVGAGPQHVLHVYPGQQADVDRDLQTEDPRAIVDTADPETFVLTLPPEIMEAMVNNMADIRQENEELSRQLAEIVGQGESAPDPNANLLFPDVEDLNAYAEIVNTLVVAILAEAVHLGVLTQEEAQSLVEQLNEAIEDSGRRYSLEDVPEIRRDIGIDPALREEKERARQQQQEREREKEERRRQLLGLNREKVDQILRDRQQQEQANREALDRKDQQAVGNHLNSLSGQERAALERRIRERQQELQEQQGQTGGNTGTGGSGDSGGGQPGGTPGASVEAAFESNGNGHVLNILLSNIENLFAVQLEVEYQDENQVEGTFRFHESAFLNYGNGLNAYRNIPGSPIRVDLAEDWEPPAGYEPNAVDHVESLDGKVRYALMMFDAQDKPVPDVDIGSGGLLIVRMPFHLELPPGHTRSARSRRTAGCRPSRAPASSA